MHDEVYYELHFVHNRLKSKVHLLPKVPLATMDDTRFGEKISMITTTNPSECVVVLFSRCFSTRAYARLRTLAAATKKMRTPKGFEKDKILCPANVLLHANKHGIRAWAWLFTPETLPRSGSRDLVWKSVVVEQGTKVQLAPFLIVDQSALLFVA